MYNRKKNKKKRFHRKSRQARVRPDYELNRQRSRKQNKHKTLEENTARAQKHYSKGSSWSTRNWQRQWGTRRLKYTKKVKLIRAGQTVIVENNKLTVRLRTCRETK